MFNISILFQKHTYIDAINSLSSLISEHRSVKSGQYKRLVKANIDKLNPADYPTYNSEGKIIRNYKSKINEEK